MVLQQSPKREMKFSRYDREAEWTEDSHSPIFGLDINDKGYLEELDSDGSIAGFIDLFEESS